MFALPAIRQCLGTADLQARSFILTGRFPERSEREILCLRQRVAISHFSQKGCALLLGRLLPGAAEACQTRGGDRARWTAGGHNGIGVAVAQESAVVLGAEPASNDAGDAVGNGTPRHVTKYGRLAAICQADAAIPWLRNCAGRVWEKQALNLPTLVLMVDLLAT